MATDVPTDPDDYALYMFYGPNWRDYKEEDMRSRSARDFAQGFRHDMDSSGFSAQNYINEVLGIYESVKNKYFQMTEIYNNGEVPAEFEEEFQRNIKEIQDMMFDYQHKINQFEFENNPQAISADMSAPNNYQDPNKAPYSDPYTNPRNYAQRLYTDPNDMYTDDFMDFDKDGVDDRYQLGPGQPREDVGSRYQKPGYSYPLPVPEANTQPIGNDGSPYKPPKSVQAGRTAAQQTNLAYEMMKLNKAAESQAAPPQGRDEAYTAPAAPSPSIPTSASQTFTAPAPAPDKMRGGETPDFGVNNTPTKPTMSDQFIPRYERDSSAFEPSVKKTVSKSTKVKAR